MSQQGRLTDIETAVETLTGNTGGPVSPDGSANINILGDSPINVAGNPGTNTLTVETDGTLATLYTADTGTATPAADNLNIFGATVVAGTSPTSTSASGDTVTVNVQISQAVAAADATTVGLVNFDSTDFDVDSDGFVTLTATVSGGGTGATSYTEGSVLFMGSSVISEDTSNFFWDDTNNRLGVGTIAPDDSIHVSGNVKIVHTAAESDDHALIINCDSAGFGDVKCIDIVYTTGDIEDGKEEEAILINVDESLSMGGEVFGIEVLSTDLGLATIYGAKYGVNVNPILQNSGTFGDADSILNIAVDVLAALSSGGAGNISVFVADNDTLTIGNAEEFTELQFLVNTPASGAGIAPTFEFSTGVGTWTTFSPSDGTNGMQNTGIVSWDLTDIPTWATGTGSEFLIRITRTRNALATTPILDELQLSATVVFSWDKDGNLIVNTVTPITPFWTVITADQTAVVNNGYICNKGSALELLLPATAVAGDIIRVTGINTALGIKITQNAGQQIHLGTESTTVGITGFIQNPAIRSGLELVAVVPGTNTIWNVISAIGTWNLN